MRRVGAHSVRLEHDFGISVIGGDQTQATRVPHAGDHAAEANTYIARDMRKPYDYSFVG